MALKRVDNISLYKYAHGEARDYRALLLLLQEFFKIRPLKDYKQSEIGICYLRHDVDHSINGAVQMAQIEREEDVSSTYYVLRAAAYFRRSAERIIKIQELGHEVGLHHNFIAPFYRKKGQVEAQLLFLSQLAKLRRLEVDVRTVAAHGDPLCHKYKLSNYQIFSECPPQLEKLGVFPMKLSLKEHGLREACFLERDCYITDSGGGWKYTFDQYVDEWNGRFSQIKQITDFIRNLGEHEKIDRLIFLTHPVWWAFYEKEEEHNVE